MASTRPLLLSQPKARYADRTISPTAARLHPRPGGILGLIAAIVIGWLMYESAVKLNLRRFFQLTSIVLILFAAGLAGNAVHEFNELKWIPAAIEPVYDLNHIIPETTWFGQFLKALFGYNANPSLTEMLAYLGYFIVVFGLL